MTDDAKYLLLKMSRISKSFGPVEVLSDVNFDLYSGEVHVLAGENGAGKSTLIKILGGVHTDNTGKIEIEGKEVNFKSVHDATSTGISIIHQELSLIGPLNVAENIFLGKEKSSYQWLDKSNMLKHSREILKNFGPQLKRLHRQKLSENNVQPPLIDKNILH